LKIPAAAATLARMHRALISRLRGSPARQRSRVVVLGLALCFWLVAFATHIHTGNDELPSNGPSSACSFCLSLPAGAPPAAPAVSQLVPVAAETVVAIAATWVAFDVPTFYLSQGPPAK
jgi:hypothetical protein